MKHDIQPGIKGLIFDLDGTLTDTMPYHFKAWGNALKKYGAEIKTEFLQKHAGSPSLTVANKIIKDLNLNHIVTANQLLNDKTSEFLKFKLLIRPIAPVKEIVQKYHGVLPLAIGTGGRREIVEHIIGITGLQRYFDIIITANDISNFKPHPETFLKCAELMNISPLYIEVFEDTEFGLEAARNAGMIATDIRSWYDSDILREISIA